MPSSWSINILEAGTIGVSDPAIEKGKGYSVEINEAFNLYRASIKFGDYAMDLFKYADTILQDTELPIRRLFNAKQNVRLYKNRKIIEDALNPSDVFSDGWWLELVFRKKSDFFSENAFADILLSLLLFILPYNIEAEEEGAVVNTISTTHERSHINRSICLAYHGYSCKACGLNLENQYGDIARQFIHVHHLNPVSLAGITKPDPIIDLVPLCPNCHGIAHLKSPPYSIVEIQKMIISNNGKLYT
jgi:hypothetical protein